MKFLSLRAGGLAADLAPFAGGSIGRFTAGDSFDILRPARAGAAGSGRGNDASCYPLVPFSNRIRDGRLILGEEEIALDPNWPGQRHPMHGDGWARAWTIESHGEQSAVLTYEHDGRSGWPFRYAARQAFRLEADELSVSLSVENRESREVPAGLGLHPFFAREPDTELACRLAGVWRADGEVLPVERIAVPPEWDFAAARPVEGLALDNCFDGWDGVATIRWPRRGLGLTLAATQPFRHLVIYVPRGQPYFCVEPVSHANGAVAQSLLPAGAVLAGEIAFRPFKL